VTKTKPTYEKLLLLASQSKQVIFGPFLFWCDYNFISFIAAVKTKKSFKPVDCADIKPKMSKKDSSASFQNVVVSESNQKYLAKELEKFLDRYKIMSRK